MKLNNHFRRLWFLHRYTHPVFLLANMFALTVLMSACEKQMDQASTSLGTSALLTARSPLLGYTNGSTSLVTSKAKLFFLQSYPGTICVYDFSTQKVYPLILNSAFDNKCGNFDISRDGKYIVFCSSQPGIWAILRAPLDLVNNTAGTPTLLTFDGRSEDPKFSWDGTKVVYKKNGDIWQCVVSNLSSTRLTTNSDEDWAPVYSKDGNYIAFGRRTDKTLVPGDIILYTIATKTEKILTSTLIHDWFPAFNYNGDLYFVSKKKSSCGDDIYKMSKSNLLASNPSNYYEQLPILNYCGSAPNSDADPSIVYGNNNLLTFVSDRSTGRYGIYLFSFSTLKLDRILYHSSYPLLGPILYAPI